MTLSLRIPAWCTDPTVLINSTKVDQPVTPRSYFDIERSWKVNDTVELVFPMPARMLEANPLVETTRNCVSISRGPIVYCLEEVDQKDALQVLHTEIDTTKDLQVKRDENLLEGIVVITGEGYALDYSDWSDSLYRPLIKRDRWKKAAKLVAIPYYAWANRSKSPMCVWIPKFCED